MFEELLDIADNLNVEVIYSKSNIAKSFVIEIEDNFYCINLDESQFETEAVKIVSLAHEIGHVKSRTFYFNDTANINKGCAEYRADYRAAQLLMPIDELMTCIERGLVEKYELAEFFEVTEEFVERALYIYRNKGQLEGI